VTSRRILYLLLMFVALDFAVPFEPTARGWDDFEDEEESVHPASRRAERPRPAAGTSSGGSAAVSRPRPAPAAGRQQSREREAPVTRLARADTSSSPPGPPEAH
jgi:hypothetical protein